MSFLTDIRELSVLVVEPSGVQSHIVLSHLKSLGIKTPALTKDGASALIAMKKNLPNVVISCMHMPDMTGGELVEKMRADDWTRNVAFILISSETSPKYLEPVRQNGSSAILGKPFTVAQLKIALHTALDFLSPNIAKIEAPSGIELDAIKVLMVDDSPSARNFMRHVLENLGITNVIEACNGKEAVEIIQGQYFDLVITDYNMPEMDGRELTEYIRTQSWQSSLPILMVSSETNESRLSAVAQAGVSGVCDKPFEPAVVKVLLEKMLSER